MSIRQRLYVAYFWARYHRSPYWYFGTGQMSRPCQMPRRFLLLKARMFRCLTFSKVCGRPYHAPHWSHSYWSHPFVSVPPIEGHYDHDGALEQRPEHEVMAQRWYAELAAEQEREKAEQEARMDKLAELMAANRG